MKITFLVPPPFENKKIPERIFGCSYGIYSIPNIFVLTVAAILENEQHLVSYVDSTLKKWKITHFTEFIQTDDSDIYCIYSVNLSKKTDIFAMNAIRKIKPTIKMILFGPAPTDMPADYLLDSNVIIIRGEPEQTFKIVVCTLAKNQSINQINGISIIHDSEIINNFASELIQNLDAIPFPARHLINKNEYYNPKLEKKPFTAMITSRGCTGQCIYCVPCSSSFARELEYKKYKQCKPPVRMRSVENIIEEFKLLRQQGYRAVSILDDQFIWGEERTIKICNGIKNLGIVWGCLARADMITNQIAEAMASAGCKYVDIGIESFNQNVLDYVRKNLKIEQVYEAILLLKKYKIGVKVNVIFGSSPLETKEMIIGYIKKIKELKPDIVMFNIANPFPGTEFYHIAKKNNWFVYGDYIPVDVAKTAIIHYPHLTNRELEKLVRKANFEFYLNPHFILGHLKSIFSRNLLQNLISLKNKLF